MQFSSSSRVPFSTLFSKTKCIVLTVASDKVAPVSNILAFLCYVGHKNSEDGYFPLITVCLMTVVNVIIIC
jgi:hypothetical protein